MPPTLDTYEDKVWGGETTDPINTDCPSHLAFIQYITDDIYIFFNCFKFHFYIKPEICLNVQYNIYNQI